MQIKAVQIKIYNNMGHWLRKHDRIFFLVIDSIALKIASFLLKVLRKSFSFVQLSFIH